MVELDKFLNASFSVNSYFLITQNQSQSRYQSQSHLLIQLEPIGIWAR
jgi:hypothetical protein